MELKVGTGSNNENVLLKKNVLLEKYQVLDKDLLRAVHIF